MSMQRLSGRALVVQITEREIRIAQMTLGSDVISERVILPTPPNAVEDGQLVGLDALRDAMEPVLRQGLFRRCRKVVFSLCSTQVISESVTVPAVKKQQRLGQMLLANMDEYFPIDPGEYQLSWESVGVEAREDARHLRVQLWAVPRAMLHRYYALANSMGLSVAAVDFCGHSHATAVDAEVRQYDNLFNDPDPDAAGKDFLACLNPGSLEVLTGCKVEPEMRKVAEAFDKQENRTGVNAPTFQFMRVGYFCMDNRDCTAEHLVFDRSVSLKDSFKK